MISIRDTNTSQTHIILDFGTEAHGRSMVIRNKTAFKLGILLIKKSIWNMVK